MEETRVMAPSQSAPRASSMDSEGGRATRERRRLVIAMAVVAGALSVGLALLRIVS